VKKSEEKQALMRRFREETGKAEIEMHEVAEWAHRRFGMAVPPDIPGIDRLAQAFADAAREETRKDEKTGRPYRVNHAIKVTQGDRQLSFWIVIDDAPRNRMALSVQQRREQMVGDAAHLVNDIDHWNSVHADQEPIQIELDFQPDVEWRKNSEVEETVPED
jgi:hypothetical protein